jgi:hypothetical protein
MVSRDGAGRSYVAAPVTRVAAQRALAITNVGGESQKCKRAAGGSRVSWRGGASIPCLRIILAGDPH